MKEVYNNDDDNSNSRDNDHDGNDDDNDHYGNDDDNGDDGYGEAGAVGQHVHSQFFCD